ncbi:MAG: hypothetical protein RRY20_01160, partial [Bilophila sp.]
MSAKAFLRLQGSLLQGRAPRHNAAWIMGNTLVFFKRSPVYFYGVKRALWHFCLTPLVQLSIKRGTY